MSGYVQAFSPCFFCKQPFFYNPHRVPSTPPEWHPTREPVCKNCMGWINGARQAAGIAPFPIHADAYEAIPEEEL